jgi:hypothetical protein
MIALAVATVGGAGALVAVMATRPAAVSVTIPADTRIVTSLDGSITTESARVGDAVGLTTIEPIELGDGLLVPKGQALKGEVTHAKGGGRIAGAPELTVRITRLEVDGKEHTIATTPFRFKGKNDAGESALEIAGGTVAGAVLGKVIGNDALKGAVIGAAAGTAVAVVTKGDQIVLPAGTKLRVTLTGPVTITVAPERAPSPDPS